MKCKICENNLAKNGIKNGVQYYYCTHCKKSYSGKPRELNHHIFEEYIARLLYLKCVKQKNEFTQTVWTINQIARLLNHHHRDVKVWTKNKNLPKISENEFIKYLKGRENGFDILYVLGYCTATTPSENLNKIIKRKERTTKLKDEKKDISFHITESEYLRLVNMPITTRKEAIFVLGALLGCRTSEIIGAKYSDIDYNEKTIFFHRTVTFDKKIEVSEKNFLITNRKYPLTPRMLNIIAWLKTDNERNKQRLGKKFNYEFDDYICVQENGTLFSSFTLNRRTSDIQAKAKITTHFLIYWHSKGGIYNEKVREFQFKWLRYSAKLMMLQAGINKRDISNIFGYKTATKSLYGYTQNSNLLEIMRNAYEILDGYIEEKSKLLT